MSYHASVECWPSIQACKTRTILTLEQAAAIFMTRNSDRSSLKTKGKWLSSTKVASAFGVSEKTVRDIWTGRTWFHELIHLDPARAALAEKRIRPPGRPRISRQHDDMDKALLVSCTEYESRVKKTRNHRPSSLPSHSTSICVTSTPSKVVSDTSGQRYIARDSPYFGCDGLFEGCSLYQPTDSVEYDCPPAFVRNARTQGPTSQAWYEDQLPGMHAAEEAAPLPGSSCPDDPFHDDWGYWGTALGQSMGDSPAALQATPESAV